MQIAAFKKHLEKNGVNMELDALTKYLEELDLKDVPQQMVDDLTSDLKAKYATALQLVEQGQGELKGVEKPAAPAPQVPTVPRQQINFSTQSVSTIPATIEQIVRANHQGEQEAIAAVANYLAGSQGRIINGVNAHLSTVDMSAPLQSVLEQQRSAWASTHDAIRQAIANVNDFAGVKTDAA